MTAVTAAKPSAGRIVHYVSRNGPAGAECLAAIVTQVTGPQESGMWVAGLCIFTPVGLTFNPGVVQMEHARDDGTWHWPERVE